MMNKKHKILIICTAILVLCFVGTASAKTWYVDDDGGADFRTIGDAIYAASCGDTIIVKRGTYGSVGIKKPITLIGKGQPVVDAEGSRHGFCLEADDITIEGFTVINSEWVAGIDVRSSNNHITDNNINNNYHGIFLWHSDNIISGNNVCNNKVAGIYLDRSSNNFISGNTVSNNRNNGIHLDSSSNHNFISDNAVINNDYGIYLHDSSNNNTITGNDARNNNYSIGLAYSNNNIIRGNTACDNGQGINIASSCNNFITGNNVFNNPLGIWLNRYCNSNIITGNNVSNNNCGITFRISSSNNKISFNNFISNTDNVCSDDSTNTWNSIEKITYTYNGSGYKNYLGNYWGDYKENNPDAEEIEGYGIWDTPYRINSDVNDNYPLVVPFEYYSVGWSKTFGGPQGDYARAVQQTADGGFILAGETSSYGAGRSDFWIVKTFPNGTKQWSRTFGGSAADGAWSVKQTTDGGYILAGYTVPPGGGKFDVWLVINQFKRN